MGECCCLPSLVKSVQPCRPGQVRPCFNEACRAICAHMRPYMSRQVASAAASSDASLTTFVSALDIWSKVGYPSLLWGTHSPATDQSACRHENSVHLADMLHQCSSATAGAWAASPSFGLSQHSSQDNQQWTSRRRCAGHTVRAFEGSAGSSRDVAGTAAGQSTAARPAQPLL